MHNIVFSLVFFLLANGLSTDRNSDWESLLTTAERLESANTDKQPNGLRVVVYLRRALIAAQRENAPTEKIEKIRKELVEQYEKFHATKLADWYKNANLDEISKKLQEKEAEGKSSFKNDWRIRMDEFGLITIWKEDTVVPKGNPIFRYYRPSDEDYSEVLLMSRIQPKTEKPVDFDLSVIGMAFGPSYTVDYPGW